ncbi:dihydropteroate synthase [Sneathiella marina]|uniref:dihydropteroate synthase n=1 Tax=Sneathiella marina TaxID=2950108 RepID=A0ABY4W698_9PROT|nr:dihydropteroate synthase [Sneathiella marina]USG62705.1 dihydropteroate synthase [Sneathiella marina]
MKANEKGSVLPRGLSSATTAYLATAAGQIDQFQLALRESSGIIHWCKASRIELLNWCAGENEGLSTDVRNQVSALDQSTNRKLSAPTPKIMGILNVTPDSFSDGGQHYDANVAIERAHEMVAEGADILDIGGESTRPGADLVSIDEEIERIVPVIEGCRSLNVEISIDTRKEPVMKAAVAAGATMINDVSALEFDTSSLDFLASNLLPVCLMHGSADPKTMQIDPKYNHVLLDVIDYLKKRIGCCEGHGIQRNRIVVDPGIGFGKTLDHNLTLIKGLPFLQSLGCGILLGVSRKSFIGRLSGENRAENRIGGSIAAALYGATAGAGILRVHDVHETRQAVKIWQSLDSASF